MATLPINPSPAAQDMTFDAHPVQATTPVPPIAPVQQAGDPSDMAFDSAPTQQAINVPGIPPGQANDNGGHPVSGWGSLLGHEIHIDPNDGAVLNGVKRTLSIGAGVGDGLLDTLTGIGDLEDKAVSHLPAALQPVAKAAIGPASVLSNPSVSGVLHSRQTDLQHDNAENPGLNATGKGAETLAEFLSGDEVLKGLSWSDKLLKTAKIARVLEDHPLLLKAAQVGATALRSGTVQGTIGTVKSGGDLGEGAKEGVIAGGITGLLGAGGQTINAIRAAVDDSGLQPALQNGIRKIISDAADRAGVSAPTATSIRDAVQQVSDGVKAKASGLYQTLDEVSGGQAQRFRDAASNVSDQLRSIVGLDDDKEAELLVKQQKIEAGHKAMLDKLQAAGHDPNMLAQADATWKQQAALSDLSNSVRQSTTGLRPELANGAAGATTPESVNAKVLFTKVNRLNDRGRLAQAIGQDNADAMLQHVDAAYVQAQKIAQKQQWLKTAVKYALPATGAGLGFEAVKTLHDMFSSGK